MPSKSEKAGDARLHGGYQLPDKETRRVGDTELPKKEIHDHSAAKKPAVWKTGRTG